jgi:hypothetical protein
MIVDRKKNETLNQIMYGEAFDDCKDDDEDDIDNVREERTNK